MTNVSFVIVDDAVFMRTLIRKIIEQIDGYTVLAEASNGKEAIEAARVYKPDIMTLDLTMPEMDGIKALPAILEASPKTRVIVVSAMGQQSMVIDAIRHGAKDFIIKPFERYKVYQAINNVLAF
ncbi:MAG: response regulator [Clostridiaceae bacterium]|nr:response regulator [Clostridiaceae bacterium]